MGQHACGGCGGHSTYVRVRTKEAVCYHCGWVGGIGGVSGEPPRDQAKERVRHRIIRLMLAERENSGTLFRPQINRAINNVGPLDEVLADLSREGIVTRQVGKVIYFDPEKLPPAA